MPRLLALLALIAMPLLSHAVEEPKYQVIRQLDDVELRQYAPYVVAEVVLDATADDAGRQAFPILAGYIFGKNKGEKKFAMPAPVTQSSVAARTEMTAPVMQARKPGGRFVFVEYEVEDPQVPIKRLHNMSEAQIRRDAAVFAPDWERTVSTLPWQHVVVFRKRR